MTTTRRSIALVAVAALVAGVAAAFALGPHHRFGPREDRRGHRADLLAVALDLTEEQKAAIAELREEFHATGLEPFFAEKQRLREAMRQELESASPDARRLGELMLAERELAERMRGAREVHEQAVAELLTDEQRARLEELKSLREDRGRRFGPGGRHGLGGPGHRHHGGPWGPPGEQP